MLLIPQYFDFVRVRELLKAEERVSLLLQAELQTKGALAKVIRSVDHFAQSLP